MGYSVQYVHRAQSDPSDQPAVSSPMAEIERLYDELSLPGWKRARGPIADYLGTLSGYRKNAYRVDQATIDAVDRKWGFAVEAWGYRPPDTEVG